MKLLLIAMLEKLKNLMFLLFLLNIFLLIEILVGFHMLQMKFLLLQLLKGFSPQSSPLEWNY
jgi:hypothetical protein